MPEITVSALRDLTPSLLAKVGASWQALEAAADGSFFQSWAWIGCLAAERHRDPVLLEARMGGRVVALALFGRSRRARYGCGRAWYLAETGRADLDRVFIEHNAPLIAADVQGPARRELLEALLRAALAGGARLVLGGVPDALAAAAQGLAGGVWHARMVRAAPWIDLDAVRAGGGYLDRLRASSRQLLRRSARGYATWGELRIARAETLAEAHAALDALAVLHQAAWQARGRPGAFADPAFGRFHHALIDRAWPMGGIDLLCVTAGGRVLGHLYNFRHRGRVLAYQSGFDFAASAADARLKPGLTCHHLAIGMYLAEGAVAYDFLAGRDRYKSSLAMAETTLHWLELARAGSAQGRLMRLEAVLRRLRSGWRARSGSGWRARLAARSVVDGEQHGPL